MVSEMSPEQVAAKIKIDREITADNSKRLEQELLDRRMAARREIENRNIEKDCV